MLLLIHELRLTGHATGTVPCIVGCDSSLRVTILNSAERTNAHDQPKCVKSTFQYYGWTNAELSRGFSWLAIALNA